MITRKPVIFLHFLLIPLFSISQKQTLKQLEADFLSVYNKLFAASYKNTPVDSVDIYNAELKKIMLEGLSKNPATLNYSFKKLTDSLAFTIVTSEDSLFRIYSWDTWAGGTMHFYNNIFQYKYKGKVITEFNELEEGDCGSFFPMSLL